MPWKDPAKKKAYDAEYLRTRAERHPDAHARALERGRQWMANKRAADPTYGLESRERWRLANIDRTRAWHREYMREYLRAHPEARARMQAYQDALPAIVKQARRAVRTALAKGQLVRPDACERCGTTAVIPDAAHVDYAESLNVLWLCRLCHKAYDTADPKVARHR